MRCDAGDARASERVAAIQVYDPTILTDVPTDALVVQEETFGPVVVVEAVDTPEEAVAAANRTMYGLSSSILSGDTYRAFELAPRIRCGIVNVNTATVNDEIHAPMGGVRDSGWGRTGPVSPTSATLYGSIHAADRRHTRSRARRGSIGARTVDCRCSLH